VQKYLWTGNQNSYNGGAIKYDLDWVAQNWQSNGCDLWEEVQSNDFFWNRYNFRYGLTVGAKVASKLGDTTTANYYLTAAKNIQSTILNHYNGQFIYESTNRQKDSAVINGINDGYLNDGFLAPTDYRVSGTISTLNDVFNSMFPVNTFDTQKGYGGVLYGRYQGDTYAGGNPWILSTAALAQLYYNGATETLRAQALPGAESMKNFRKVLNLGNRELSYKEFAQALTQAGDDVLFRLRSHVVSYNFHLSEQLDKNTGAELSAGDLTWSYACVLKAMYYRGNPVHGLV
jgi:glucoamylase